MATAAEEASPAISPSGRLVAYTSTESGRREVYVRPFGKQGRKWTVSTGGGSAPKWRRDERELFYLEGNRLMAAAVEGGAALTVGTPRVLFEESALSMEPCRSLPLRRHGRWSAVPHREARGSGGGSAADRRGPALRRGAEGALGWRHGALVTALQAQLRDRDLSGSTRTGHSLPNHQALAVVARRVDVAHGLLLPAGLAHERHFDADRLELRQPEVHRRRALRVVAAAGHHLARGDDLARRVEQPHFGAEARVVALRVEHEHAEAALLRVGRQARCGTRSGRPIGP